MRILMWLSLGFCGACLCGAYFYNPDLWYICLPALAACAGAFVLGRRVRFMHAVGCLLLGLSLGVGWFCVYDHTCLANARALDGQKLQLEVRLTDYGNRNDYGTTVTGSVTLNGKDHRVLLYLDEDGSYVPGDQVTGKFRLRFTSVGSGREPTYHSSKGDTLLAYQAGSITLTPAAEPSSQYWPVIWRHSLLEQIDSLFSGDSAVFAKALLLGDRSGFSYELDTAFRLSGISHIVAVSGLHVSMMFGIITLLLGRRRWLTGIVSLPVLFVFAAMMGFTPSVCRACIMQGLLLVAAFADREYDGPTALSFAALVMVLADPMVITSASFQMSFACVTGILLFAQRITQWLSGRSFMTALGFCKFTRGLIRGFCGSVGVSLSAMVFTAPLIAVYFGAVSLVSVITNLLVVWLLPFIFCGVLLACTLSAIAPGGAMFIVAVTSALIHIVLDTARALSRLPFAAVYTCSDYIIIWLVAVYLLLGVFLCMKRKRAGVLTCCALILLCVCCSASVLEPMTDRTRVTVLNVGQGQSILLQSDGKSFLVDCGGDSPTASADLAAETLLSQGIFHLDGLILTHFDKDHAAGAALLVQRMSIGRIYLPLIADEFGYGEKIRQSAGERVVTVDSDIYLTYGDSRITVFGPELYDLSNDSGMCILFQHENCDILITGDRSELGEALLLHRTQLPELELLIAGHHGSNGSTGEALLEATRPEYVFISVSDSNPYGHPAPQLLQRLAQFGCKVYRTDRHGTIIYRG